MPRSMIARVGLRALFGAWALCAGGVAWAASFHVCDCAAGADAACVAGNDAAAVATPSTPWRSYERARNAFATLGAGDEVLFCRGGSFALGAATRWVNSTCRDDAPCTIGAYSPPWGGGGARPRLVQGAGGGFGFDDGGNAEHEEGYVLRDLDLRCTGCDNSHSGVFLYNDIDDVRIEGMRIAGFGIGVYLAGSQPCSPGAPGCDGANSRIALRGSEIRDNRYHGFLGAGDDLAIEDNDFRNNGSEPTLEHNLYLGGNAARLPVARNTLYRSAALAAGRCLGSSLVAHGNLVDLVIEDNLVREDIGAAAGSCWGIDLNPGYVTPESFVRAIVRRNTVLNVGTAAIALGACVDCVVENNVIVHAQPHAVIAIRAPGSQFGDGDAVLHALVVRNNSIHVATSNSVGIAVGGEGDGHVVVGNAIESTASGGFWSCLSLDLPVSAYAAVDHNVCGYAAGAGHEWEAGSGALAAWRVGSGLDANSVFAPPGFALPGAAPYDLSASGPAAAMVGRGHPGLGATHDIHAELRGTPPDAGAFQWQTALGPLLRDGFEAASER
jgi:hypothetical protein